MNGGRTWAGAGTGACTWVVVVSGVVAKVAGVSTTSAGDVASSFFQRADACGIILNTIRNFTKQKHTSNLLLHGTADWVDESSLCFDMKVCG
jgi:hypothetical protein